MSPIRYTVLLILLIQGLTSFGQKTDTIVLYNGDRIIGDIKGMSLGKLKYSTEKMGTIFIEWDGIHHLVTNKTYEFKSSGGSVYYASIGKAQSPTNLLLINNTDTFELDKERIVEITRLRSRFWDRLDGAIDIGLNQQQANDLIQWSLGFNSDYRTKYWLSQIMVNSIITDQSERDTQRKQDAAFTLVRYIGGRGVTGIRVAAEQNTELGLNLRASTTLTGGADLLHTNKQVLIPTAGLMLNREWSNGQEKPTENLEGVIMALYKAFNYDDPELSVDVLAQFFPSFTVKDRYRFNSDLKLRYEILNDLFIGASFYFQYDSKPPNSTAATSDYGTKLSIGYSW